MNKSVYFTKKIKIELLLADNMVKIISYGKRGKGRVYSFDARRLYQVMKTGGSKQIVPIYGEEKCVEISFSLAYHPAGKHMAGGNNKINTYIDDVTYEIIMKNIEEGLINDKIV